MIALGTGVPRTNLPIYLGEAVHNFNGLVS